MPETIEAVNVTFVPSSGRATVPSVAIIASSLDVHVTVAPNTSFAKKEHFH